jgi:hypothetical protein
VQMVLCDMSKNYLVHGLSACQSLDVGYLRRKQDGSWAGISTEIGIF